MPRMSTLLPARKVSVATLGAAVATITVWILKDKFEIQLPDAVELAIISLATFAVGYMAPPAERDSLEPNS